MAAPTQRNRNIAIGTPLGDDVLLFRSVSGSEKLSRLFCYEIDLASDQTDISPDDIVGQNITVRIETAQGSTRFINGMVRAFTTRRTTGRLAAYHATVVPALWMLTRTSDCKIYQNVTVPDIITEALNDHGITDFENRLTATYRTWENCVQYRETDFNFISRLMEQEGIYYYFEHENGRHVLVLADGATAHSDFEGYATVSYRPPDQASTTNEHVRQWHNITRVQPGAYVLDDFDFKNPSLELQASAEMQSGHTGGDFEMFDAPGEYVTFGDGQTYSQIRLEEFHSQHQSGGGDADARGICSGYTMELTDHPNDAENGRYLVTSTTLSARSDAFSSGDGGDSGGGGGGGGNFSCTFTVIGADVQFRAKRLTPKPAIQGPQTAIVTGPAGEEIYTDEYGRVKVQFHWDRYSAGDDTSSCWIRVAQVWAGKKWGAMYIPRIGQEVIVEYLEGDPDQPIVTGRVYNGSAMPPYDLPADKTKSTIKSNSTIGGAGYNEIRFEDKKGQEQIYIHAEKNQDVRVGADLKESIGNDAHRTVKNNEYETVKVDKHVHVISNLNEAVDVDHSLTVGNNQQVKVGMKQAVEAGQEIHLKAGMKVVIEAGLQLTIKGPGGFVDIGPGGVTIQGTMVMINSGGAAGVGSGSSPTAPTDAAGAASGSAGQVSAAAVAPQPPTPATYGPGAQSVQQSAASGSPASDTTTPAEAQQPSEGDPAPPAPATQSPDDDAEYMGYMDEEEEEIQASQEDEEEEAIQMSQEDEEEEEAQM